MSSVAIAETGLTWAQLRGRISRIDPLEYAGVPTPVAERCLKLAKGHPWFDRLDGYCLDDAKNEKKRQKHDEDSGLEFVNSWHRYAEGRTIYVMRENGKAVVGWIPQGPMQKATAYLEMMGISLTMDVDAEKKAQSLLESLIPRHLFDAYQLTGTFIETSKRSGVCYLFRRLAPTIALKAGLDGNMRFLAALCLHPIAYYDGLPMGAMVPTDDVIAHLQLMRADEHLYWRKSIQHSALDPGAFL